MSNERRERGEEAESLAARYLQRQGLRLITRNYRCRGGELDLVMDDGEQLVFVEVRFRSNPRFGGAAESIDRHKQARLITAARHYLQRHSVERPCRFDVVAIEPGLLRPRLEWLKNVIESS